MIKDSSLQEDTALLAGYKPNKSVKIQKAKTDRTKGEIDKSIITVETSTLLSQ